MGEFKRYVVQKQAEYPVSGEQTDHHTVLLKMGEQQRQLLLALPLQFLVVLLKVRKARHEDFLEVILLHEAYHQPEAFNFPSVKVQHSRYKVHSLHVSYILVIVRVGAQNSANCVFDVLLQENSVFSECPLQIFLDDFLVRTFPFQVVLVQE